jgi:hypothetical protein
MCDVRVVERPRSCHIFCDCGYEGYMLRLAPHCPQCNGAWEHPRFENFRDGGDTPMWAYS